MRNLKRALSLTLASVMLLGMMVVGSSALSFNDADDISNVTAATVLEELGVMQGDGQGNFMPEQTVTRAQMAILICRILYGDRLNVRQFEGTTQYTDVGANDYYTGYINLATSLGIINGYGDGRFGPDDTVTTAQAALMLSRALGYFQANELEGQDWALAAVAQATKIDMFGNLKLATNEGLARDNVAEMVFNTMTAAVPVHYSERWDVYYTDTQSILAGVNFDYRNTLGYTNFDLVYSENKSDDFNRPATEWGTGTVVGSTDDKGNIVNANIKNSFIKAVNDVDATYTAKVKMSDIYKDLGLGEAVAASKVSTYRNGKSVASEDLSRSNETKIGGNGVLTQVWYDSDDKTATISMIDTFVGKVSTVNRATSSADRSVTISQFPVTGSLGSALDAKFETENFAAKDVVLYTAAWNGSKYEIQTMEALGSPVTGTLTKWVGTTVDVDTGKSESSLTVDSTTYKYDVNVVVADENDSQVAGVWSQFTVNESEINVYTDKYGYAIYVSGVEGEKNYAAVIGTGNTNPYGDETTGVTLLLPDGTRKSVTAKLKTGSQFADDQGNKGGNHGNQKVDDVIGDLVSYKIKDDGVYELTVLDNWTRKATSAEISSTIPAGAANMSAGVTCFTNGKSLIKLGGANYYVTDDTVFFVATDLDDVAYSVYVGYDAMPSFGNDSEHGSDLLEGYAFKTRNEYTTQLEAVYIAADALGGTSSVDTYFVKKADADIETDSTGSYYILPAIVDGAVTEIKLDATNIIAGIDWRKNGDNSTVGVFAIKNVTKDKNDIITNFALASDALNATDGGSKTGTVATARGVLGIGSTVAGSTVYWVYNNSTKAYRVNEDLDEITAIDVASIGTDTNDRVYAKADSDTKVLQDVIVVEVEDDAAPDVPSGDPTVDVVVTAVLDDEDSEVTFLATGTDRLSIPEKEAAIKDAYVKANSRFANTNNTEVKYELVQGTGNGYNVYVGGTLYATYFDQGVTQTAAVPSQARQWANIDMNDETDAGQWGPLVQSDFVSNDAKFTPTGAVETGSSPTVEVTGLTWITDFNVKVPGFFYVVGGREDEAAHENCTIKQAYFIQDDNTLKGTNAGHDQQSGSAKVDAFAIVPILRSDFTSMDHLTWLIVFRGVDGKIYNGNGAEFTGGVVTLSAHGSAEVPKKDVLIITTR